MSAPGGNGPDAASVQPTSGGTHGDHWQSVFGERVDGVLPLAQQAFTRPAGRGTVRHDGRTRQLTLARAEAVPAVDLVAAALDGQLATAFPMLREAAPSLAATLQLVAPWPNGLEAWVEAHLEGLGFVNFYPVDYITSQPRYHEGAAGGEPVRVAFSAIAYTMSPSTEDQEDDLAPASDFVPKAYPDDYWWCGTVRSVDPVEGGYVAQVRVNPAAGARLQVPIYVRDDGSAPFRPKEGERASGFFWLQGRLVHNEVRP